MRTASPLIDAHHHLWRYTPAEYGWIDSRMAAIRRDFLLPDLLSELSHVGVDGAITVQARQALEETHWLLDLANNHETIRGVVGWAPIAAPEFEDLLPELAAEPKLLGLRHIVQAEAAGFLDGPDFNRGIRAMRSTGLIYDILIAEPQLREAIRFIDRHPQQQFVLDHIAKPRIAIKEIEPWRTNIRELSKRSNVACKLSGIVTEDSWSQWSLESIRPYLDVAVEAFQPDRLMAGSDWPVCLVASGYAEWWNALSSYFAGFTEVERAKIFGITAISTYDLKESRDHVPRRNKKR
ncbi:MAG TPA: amidohydrolase family protein [Edaphobacter sp.]|jgi:L-fuconolactonase|nr:amidohydrolase family protein [Edaphobacter sp.]